MSRRETGSGWLRLITRFSWGSWKGTLRGRCPSWGQPDVKADAPAQPGGAEVLQEEEGEVSERATRSGWELSLSRAHFQKQTTSSMEAIYNQLHIPLPSRREATGPVLWFLLITWRLPLHSQAFVFDLNKQTKLALKTLKSIHYRYHIYFWTRGKRSLRWQFLGENYGQVTLLTSLFTLQTVLVNFFW